MAKTILLNEADNIAVAIGQIDIGDDPLGIQKPLKQRILGGHKLATKPIDVGQPIVKFGHVIGYATIPIEQGDHVHSHNCSFGEHSRKYEIGRGLEATQLAIPKVQPTSFNGYRRNNGKVGTRNMIALCSTVNCSATAIRQAAAEIQTSGVLDQFPNVDGIIALTHGSGCGMASSGPGCDNLQRVLWGYATHPNIGAAVFVGLGCEVMQVSRMRTMFNSDGTEGFHGLTIQEAGGTRATIEKIIEKVRELLPQVNKMERSDCNVSELVVGLQCGGSDGFSGITANPACLASAHVEQFRVV